MDRSTNVQDVRSRVCQCMAQLGATPAELASIEELILIDRGEYRGRSYRTERLFAMWMVEIGIVQIYDAAGEMLQTIGLNETAQAERRAA